MIVATVLIPIVLVGMSLSKECVPLESRVTCLSDTKLLAWNKRWHERTRKSTEIGVFTFAHITNV